MYKRQVVEDAVQQDIQEQKALEEKRQMEQMPKGSIHERLAWGCLLYTSFHLLDMEENLPSIKQGLEAKLDALVMRDLYSKYKTAATEEEREQARKEYLDKRGVPEKFRW